MSTRSHTLVNSPSAAVTPLSPLRWLALGWADLRSHPLPGLLHGLALAVFGWLLLGLAHEHFWLLAGAFSGFLIVAPILATGLYHISRERSAGRTAGLGAVVGLWRSMDGRLVRFGLLLGLAGTGWVLTSAGLITLLSPAPIEKPLDFLRHVVMVRELGLFEIWLLMGALLAAPIYASSVMAIPMLVDTRLPVSMAVGESWRTVASQPVVMALWALVLALLTGIGMLTALLGLIVIVPWLAHASWHAYQDLTARSPYKTSR
ncbi:MAG: DUF2189 domain-containing protein [Hydrogenophaga sp.]